MAPLSLKHKRHLLKFKQLMGARINLLAKIRVKTTWLSQEWTLSYPMGLKSRAMLVNRIPRSHQSSMLCNRCAIWDKSERSEKSHTMLARSALTFVASSDSSRRSLISKSYSKSQGLAATTILSSMWNLCLPTLLFPRVSREINCARSQSQIVRV